MALLIANGKSLVTTAAIDGGRGAGGDALRPLSPA
jgi:hypothetical protein